MTATGQTITLEADSRAPIRSARSVDRERLRVLLDGAPGARLVLVSAPAGFGKTTLLATWLAGTEVRSAWCSLDVRDSDVVRFARRVAAAIDRLVGIDVEEAPGDPGQPFDAELALVRIVASLERAVEIVTADGRAGVVLVLDDYHAIEATEVHAFVATLIERLPPGARLAIATRADPPFPLARLRAHDELLEVRAEDLRFTSTEADELLRSAEVELASNEVDALTERTEGWAAVLRLAAVSLRDQRDRDEAVRRFGASHRFVLDYVVEEVLTGSSRGTQDFLLRTSILDRLCGPLCDAVTGDEDGQARLEELERANLLILPLDDERRWYRYHALFAEVLRARLRALRPDVMGELHARASRWHEARGDDDEAVAHALLADDLDRTCRLVEFASVRRLNAGDLATVRRWVDALPPAAVRANAQLSSSAAWCLALAGETEGVRERLADAEQALDASRAGERRDAPADARLDDGHTPPGIVRSELALLRSRLADLEGDPVTAAEQARLARELVPTGVSKQDQAILRGDATILLARALLASGDTAGAAAAYEASLPDLRAGGNLFAVGRAIADLALLALERGDQSRAARLCEEELARTPEATSAARSPSVWAALARARVELGQVELAAAAARRSLDLAVRFGDAPSARSAQRTLDRIQPLLTKSTAAPVPTPAQRAAGLVEALTPREIEVLRLVALGRSNTRIATELFVTVGTVKSHVHSISGKLGAANRTEAVARGRDLGLLH